MKGSAVASLVLRPANFLPPVLRNASYLLMQPAAKATF